MRQNYLLPNIERWTPEQGPIVKLEHVTQKFGDKVVLDYSGSIDGVKFDHYVIDWDFA